MWSFLSAATAQVVINEIHYHPVELPNFDAAGNPIFVGTATPADFTEDVHEFVELQNNGATAVNLSGWKLSEGITFTFPAGQHDCRRVVASWWQRIPRVWPQFTGSRPASILGPYVGQLSNDNETVRLLRSDDTSGGFGQLPIEFPVADQRGFSRRGGRLDAAEFERVSV